MRGGGFVRQTGQSVLALYVWLWDSFRSISLRAENTRQKNTARPRESERWRIKTEGEKEQGTFQAPGPMGLISHTGLIQ